MQAHTNLTEIKEALNLFWRVGVDPNKVVLGMAFYGRSYTMSDTDCMDPGCSFSGAGTAGPCTDSAGTLSYKGINPFRAP
jgi:chitinase